MRIQGYQKDWGHASEMYEKAIILEPNKAEAYYNLAGCREALGDTPRAQSRTCGYSWRSGKETKQCMMLLRRS